MSTLARSLTLFRAALFCFYGMESGTFMLMPYAPLGGTRPLLHRVAELLGRPAPADEATLRELAAVYLDFCLDFRTLVQGLALAPGRYRIADASAAWEAIDLAHPPLEGADGAPETNPQYELALRAALDDGFAAHLGEADIAPLTLALIRAPHLQLRLEDLEHGGRNLMPMRRDDAAERAPVIDALLAAHHAQATDPARLQMPPMLCGDGKRPYGDRTYYFWDLEDLGVPGVVADGAFNEHARRRDFSDARAAEIDRAHAASPLALQALARYGVPDEALARALASSSN